MNAQDEAKRLRARDVILADSVRFEFDPDRGAPCLAAQTKTLNSYPVAAARYYACTCLTVLGAEIEGGAGVVTAANSTFFALNLGSAIPPAGTSLLVTFVGNRWVFRHDG